jgi:hypothetical protein
LKNVQVSTSGWKKDVEDGETEEIRAGLLSQRPEEPEEEEERDVTDPLWSTTMFSVILLCVSLTPPGDTSPELPELSDLEWFPTMTRAETLAEWQRWCKHVEWLRELEQSPASLFHQSEAREWLQTAILCRNQWDAFDDAHLDARTETWRRERLAHYRDLVGRDAYYRGLAPPMLPAGLKYPALPSWPPESKPEGGGNGVR